VTQGRIVDYHVRHTVVDTQIIHNRLRHRPSVGETVEQLEKLQ
jgi:hypothetical protein